MFGIETSDESCPAPLAGRADLLASDKRGDGKERWGRRMGERGRRRRHENEKKQIIVENACNRLPRLSLSVVTI